MSAPQTVSTIVTGATGFVGRALMASRGMTASTLSLAGEAWRSRAEALAWRGAGVVHLAARVHEPGPQQEAAYQRDNVDKTRELATLAAEAGARRFVFLSSIKVHGEETTQQPFRATDVPAPQDAYARSKWDAERALQACAAKSGMELVVVRSPLVVGPGAAGNLLALLGLADTAWPLPLAGIDNRRTLIDVDDLVSLLRACLDHPLAAGQTFLAGSPESVSTPQLVTALRTAQGRPARLFALAPATLEAVAGAVGWGERIRRLTRSLEVDSSQTTQVLGWTAATPIQAALVRMARASR